MREIFPISLGCKKSLIWSLLTISLGVAFVLCASAARRVCILGALSLAVLFACAVPPSPRRSCCQPGGRPSGNGRGEVRARSIGDCRIRLFSESIMLMKILTCDCTNLMGQNHSNPVNEKQRASTIEANDKVSYETIITWQQSFDNLMTHKQGQKIFAEFLKGEYSDENILFWQACEELKREKNAEKIEEKARIIYEDFISILSPKEVSLDSRVRETVNNNMQKPSANTFDDAQSQIYTLMQRDSYPRFLASPMYKNLVGGGTVEDL